MLPKEYTNAPIKGTFRYAYETIEYVLKNLNGKKALDFGCGTGRSSRVLKKLGAEVTGVDIRQDMIKGCKEQFPDSKFVLIGNKLPFQDNSFDIVIASFVHLEISNLVKINEFTKEIFRVLKPGGNYLILTANPEMWGNSYETFSSGFPENFNYKSGEKVNITMKTIQGEITFQDHYWKEKDYTRVIENIGFKVKKIRKISAEKFPEPFLLISSFK
ncbi:MAG: class I SAM-dependent methyltransferase [archaeon]